MYMPYVVLLDVESWFISCTLFWNTFVFEVVRPKIKSVDRGR